MISLRMPKSFMRGTPELSSRLGPPVACLAGLLLFSLARVESKSQSGTRAEKRETTNLPLQSTEWLMSQKQRALGIHKIYFTKNAIRIECQTNGYSICGHAPDWKMFAFRNDDKVYRISTLEDYRRNFPPSYPEVKKARVVKVGEGAKGGLNISVYKVFFSNNSGLYYSMIDKPEVSPKVAEVLLAYYRLCSPVSGLLFRVARGPNGQKLPDLKEWKNDLLTDTQANQPLDIVSTGEVTKVPYRASDFECPKGYKLVAMGNDIFTSKKQKESFSDVFNDMGLGVGFGKK